MINKIHQYISKQIKEFDETGLSGKSDFQKRIINKDGSFNVHKKGIPFLDRFSFYHWLINISWTKFNLVVISTFLLVNFIFSWIYVAIGFEHFKGIEGNSFEEKYSEVLFFSFQTFTTVGYGRISPIGWSGGFISAMEALLGLMSVALATGLLYGRFSKPQAKIKFSSNALIAPYANGRSLQFRLVNTSISNMMKMEIQVMVSYLKQEEKGLQRKYYELKLERNSIIFFPMSWTVVHPIDEDSPLFGYDEESMKKSNLEILILLRGFDDSFSQQTYTRYSYLADEIIWNARYKNIFNSDHQGTIINDIGAMSEFEKVTEVPIVINNQ